MRKTICAVLAVCMVFLSACSTSDSYRSEAMSHRSDIINYGIDRSSSVMFFMSDLSQNEKLHYMSHTTDNEGYDVFIYQFSSSLPHDDSYGDFKALMFYFTQDGVILMDDYYFKSKDGSVITGHGTDEMYDEVDYRINYLMDMPSSDSEEEQITDPVALEKIQFFKDSWSYRPTIRKAMDEFFLNELGIDVEEYKQDGDYDLEELDGFAELIDKHGKTVYMYNCSLWLLFTNYEMKIFLYPDTGKVLFGSISVYEHAEEGTINDMDKIFSLF